MPFWLLLAFTYTGIQERARATSLQSDLTQAAKILRLSHANTGTYPSSLPDEVRPSSGNVLQLTAAEEGKLCINGYGQKGSVASVSSDSSNVSYLCNGALIGSPIGGTVPEVEKNFNLVPGFAAWKITGGLTYDPTTSRICVSSVSGQASSPLVRVEGSTSARLILEAHATQPSPNGTLNSRTLYSSAYYEADGVTRALNTSNYTSNGNAQNLPLSTWTAQSWSTLTGPAVKYIRFTISSDPSNYTSDNCYRNPQITIS